MEKSIPPFKQLVSFESTARLGSFTLAAEELKITHSAISQNIKALEKILGISLITRNTHKVELTPLGEIYLSEIQTALGIISNVSGKLISDKNSLTINMPTSFSVKWLESRIEEFKTLNPDISVRLTALRRTITAKDFDKEKIDISIDYGTESSWPGCRTEKLLCDKLIAVASPKLFKGKIPSEKKLFKKYKSIIISSNIRKNDYKQLCAAAGISEPLPKMHIYYTSSANAINAVISGLGVFVTHKIIVNDSLLNGTLIKVSDLEAETPMAYYLVYPEVNINLKSMNSFRSWIRTKIF